MPKHTKTTALLSSILYFSMANSGSGYEIEKATTVASGGTTSGSNYQIKGSIGQSEASNNITGGAYGINGGIWTTDFNNDIIFKNGFEK